MWSARPTSTPEGGDGENPDLAALAVDGDTDTAWGTETYRTPAFGGGKSGVGIELTLAADADVSSIEVTATDASWSAHIYVGAGGAESLAAWGPVLASGDDLGRSARFAIDPSVRGSAVLIWLTRLPDSGRLEITEVRIG